MRIEKIISGGQTGVDRAALDSALDLHIPCGGWCPKGRWAEDGPIPGKYPLQETPSEEVEQRTEWNVRESDGTLILYRERLSGGTAYTCKMAVSLGKPVLMIDLNAKPGFETLLRWFEEYAIRVLNIAGPRESQEQGIYTDARDFLQTVLNL